MKRQLGLLRIVTAFSLAMASPAHAQGQQATDPVDHSAHHAATEATQAAPPATAAMPSMTSAAKLDELVKKMNSAAGTAKTEAMAELLTALVQDRHACEPMMADMKKMMEMMGGANGAMPMKPAAK